MPPALTFIRRSKRRTQSIYISPDYFSAGTSRYWRNAEIFFEYRSIIESRGYTNFGYDMEMAVPWIKQATANWWTCGVVGDPAPGWVRRLLWEGWGRSALVVQARLWLLFSKLSICGTRSIENTRHYTRRDYMLDHGGATIELNHSKSNWIRCNYYC
jgi:hypothetical protein